MDGPDLDPKPDLWLHKRTGSSGSDPDPIPYNSGSTIEFTGFRSFAGNGNYFCGTRSYLARKSLRSPLIFCLRNPPLFLRLGDGYLPRGVRYG